MEANNGSKKVVWLQRLCSGSGFVQKVVRIGCDISSEFFIKKSPAYHYKTKNIDV